MPRKKKDDSTPALSNPIPVRLPLDTVSRADEAVKKLPGYSQQDVLRLSAQIGLAALGMLEYNVPELLARLALEKTEDGRAAAEPRSTIVRAPHHPTSSKRAAAESA